MFKTLTSSALILALSAGSALAKETPKFDTDADKASYGIGLNIGNSLKAQSLPDLNLEAIYVGIGDAVTDSELKVDKEQLVAAFAAIQKKDAEAKARIATENLKAGDEFLAKNSKVSGVQTTKSGLQYKVLKAGNGNKPKAEDIVVTNYVGKLVDGTEFDSSYKRNEPAEFPVNRVIPGWSEALQMMPVGSKWELYIPAKLAYGEFSPTPSIPANSTLVFDVELLDIKDAAKAEK